MEPKVLLVRKQQRNEQLARSLESESVKWAKVSERGEAGND